MYSDDEPPPGFEWDPDKAERNRARHGVSFREAATAFSDPRALLLDDPVHSVSEGRHLLLGLSPQLRVLIVSLCFRGPDDRIRIISARRATSHEREKYVERSF